MNLLGNNIDTGTVKNTGTLTDASKGVGLEVNAKTTIWCYLISRMQGSLKS
jgi:hypothetical protein